MVEFSSKLSPERIQKILSFDGKDRWAVPALSRLKTVDSVVPPRAVTILDDTFRESTNMPGSNPTNKQKIELARMLEAAGIKEIVGGYSGISEQCDFMKMVKDSGIKMKVHATLDLGDFKRCIGNAVAAGVDGVSFGDSLNMWPARVGRLGSRYAYGGSDFDLAASLDLAKAAIQTAKDKGLFVTAARALMDPEIFSKTLETYVKAGADAITIFDDKGDHTPQAMAYTVKMHRDVVGPDVKLRVHCHDDFGLALANTLEAVRAGADVVDCVVNGYSHRSGNTSLDQIVLALEVLYGVPTGIDLTRLTSIAKFASEIFGVPIPAQAPHIGASAYSYGGIHVTALLQEGWFVWEGLRAETIGQKRHVVWTPTALQRFGTAGPVAIRIKSMGLDCSEEQLEKVFARLREVFAEKKVATDEELEQIAREVLGK